MHLLKRRNGTSLTKAMTRMTRHRALHFVHAIHCRFQSFVVESLRMTVVDLEPCRSFFANSRSHLMGFLSS